MYYSPSLVLTQQALVDPNRPRICWINYASSESFSATSQTDESPVSNLGNPSTAFGWEASSVDDQDIDIQIDGFEIDYIGIARHNLDASAEIRLQVSVDGVYYTIFDWDAVPSRQSLLYLINTATPDTVRISLRNNSEAPRVGVVYVGISTKLPHNIYVGHTPINMGRTSTETGGFSESGQYLGRVVRRESYGNSVSLQNINPVTYRMDIDPFINRTERAPFFFAWRPETYPDETGYCWISGNPQPSNQRANGMMSVSMNLEAIV